MGFPRLLLPNLQQLVGASERLKQKLGNKAANEDWLELIENARDRLTQRPFVALPLDGFIRREGDKERVLGVPRMSDRLIEEALLPVLNRTIESVLSLAAHGYRLGYSTLTAALSSALADGFHYLAFLDIADFFWNYQS